MQPQSRRAAAAVGLLMLALLVVLQSGQAFVFPGPCKARTHHAHSIDEALPFTHTDDTRKSSARPPIIDPLPRIYKPHTPGARAGPRKGGSTTMHMAPVDAAATVATTVTTTTPAQLTSEVALLWAAQSQQEGGSAMLLADVEEAPLDGPVKTVAGGLKNFEGLAVLGGLPVAFLATRAFSSKQREVEERVRRRYYWGWGERMRSVAVARWFIGRACDGPCRPALLALLAQLS